MALALVALSFVTSLITATFSLGGGTLMVAVLAVVFPPAIVVPLHGAIQLGSNGGRAIVQRAQCVGFPTGAASRRAGRPRRRSGGAVRVWLRTLLQTCELPPGLICASRTRSLSCHGSY